jgi:UDP-N-acetylglucosamine 2-epimerase (non-hydrolysing)
VIPNADLPEAEHTVESTVVTPRPVAVVLGTRPELIKLAGLVRHLGPRALLVHTGQHYSPEMAGDLHDELQLPEPAVQLAVGGTGRAIQIGSALIALDGVLADHHPAAIVVQGDTNAALSGALAANARELPLVHVEAGLRSDDRRMPEEHNRIVVDHLADLACAATPQNRTRLLEEGIPDSRIAVTGNPVVGAVQRLLPGPEDRIELLRRHGVARESFVLSTIHRPENTDDPDQLAAVLHDLAVLDLPVVFPIHPRTRARAEAFGLERDLEKLRVVGPLGYRDFLGLAAEAALLVSDSGGVQEEVSVLKRPLLVVRRSTERPEAIGTFAQLLQPGPELLAAAARVLDDPAAEHARLEAIPSPFGDETADAQIVAAIDTLIAG